MTKKEQNGIPFCSFLFMGEEMVKQPAQCSADGAVADHIAYIGSIVSTPDKEGRGQYQTKCAQGNKIQKDRAGAEADNDEKGRKNAQ